MPYHYNLLYNWNFFHFCKCIPPPSLRLLVDLEAAVELAEVELVRSRSAPETYDVAIAARAESETVSSDLGTTKVKIGNMRTEVREAIPERRKE